MGLRWRGLAAAAVATVILGGCSGDSDEPVGDQSAGSNAFDVVRLLPQDAQSYSTVDLAALKRGLGLSTSASPYNDRQLIPFTSEVLNGVYAGAPNRAVRDAPDLPSATALASSSAGRGPQITAVATSADPAEIRKALGDLGFVDRGGVLEGPDGERASPERHEAKIEKVPAGTAIAETEPPPVHGAIAVRFADGAFLVSDSGELLRSLGSVAGESPLRVQSSLEGDATFAFKGGGCILEQGIATNADGSGVLIFEVDGVPDPKGFSGLNSPRFGEPIVGGEQLRIPIDLDAPEAPASFLLVALPGYDCSK
ncbi:MAG: hypothetical protein WBC01_13090 [Solirubrobacterales bacterium]